MAILEEDLIRYIEGEGYTWSEENQCYQMQMERFRYWNNKVTPLAKVSFEIDAFSRAIQPAYGGDCGKSTSQILRDDNQHNPNPADGS